MHRSVSRPRYASAAALVIASAAPFASVCTPVCSAAEPGVVMHTGMEAPGTGGATFLSTFQSPAIDEHGMVVFQARLTGQGVDFDNDYALFAATPSGLVLVAREGDPAPGTDGAVFQGFGGEPNWINTKNGRIAFVASLEPGVGDAAPGRREGVWAGPPGEIDLVLRAGDPAPGVPGAVVNFMNNPWLAPDGGLAIPGHLVQGVGGVDGANERVIWSGQPGALVPAARVGDPAPGTPSRFRFFSIRGFGDAGRLGISGGITEENGVTYTEDGGLWIGPPAGMDLLAREGDPSAVIGASYRFFSGLSLNRLGEVAFSSSINHDAPGVNGFNDRAIWAGAPGSLRVVVREGDAAADVPDARYQQLISPRFTRAADVVFQSILTGDGVTPDDNYAIYQTERLSGPQLIRLVARTGDPAPGTHNGEGPGVFDSFINSTVSNAPGDVVFYAKLRNGVGGVTDANKEGLWARVPGREGLVKLVREGDPFDFDPDPDAEDLREVADFFPFDLDDAGDGGAPSPLNDDGQFAAAVPLTDGSWAIAVYDLRSFPCSPADIAPPFGLLDADDINAFIVGFTGGDEARDLNNDGLLDLADIVEFVTSFTGGCP